MPAFLIAATTRDICSALRRIAAFASGASDTTPVDNVATSGARRASAYADTVTRVVSELALSAEPWWLHAVAMKASASSSAATAGQRNRSDRSVVIGVFPEGAHPIVNAGMSGVGLKGRLFFGVHHACDMRGFAARCRHHKPFMSLCNITCDVVLVLRGVPVHCPAAETCKNNLFSATKFMARTIR